MRIHRSDDLDDRTSILLICAEVIRAAALGFVTNLSLAVVKLIGGILCNLFAPIAAAVNSVGHVVTTVIVL